MKKTILLFLIIIISFSCGVKKVKNQIKFDEKSQSDILYGYTDLDGLKKEPFNIWFDFEHDSYVVDTLTVDLIKPEMLKNFKITFVMGTWCSDSQREVPRFIKIMESVGYNINSLEIINVDSKKQADNTLVNQLKIERIPTFIFSKNGKEIGRIIESPKESLEKDILKIIGG